MSKEIYMDKAIAWAKKKPITSLKATTEEYDNPKVFTNKSTNEEVQPDLSFSHGGGEHYSDIALKSDNVRSLVTRWKLLSLMASVKKGQLHLLVPKGHKMFTKKLVDSHNINAEIHPI